MSVSQVICIPVCLWDSIIPDHFGILRDSLASIVIQMDMALHMER